VWQGVCIKMGSKRFCKRRVRSEIYHDSCSKINIKIEEKLSLKSKIFFFLYLKNQNYCHPKIFIW